MKHLSMLPFAVILCLSTGCSSSSEVIANHFDNMTQIARQYETQCDQMGQKLNEYLTQNDVSLSNAVSDVSNTKPAEAQKIYTASLELHNLTQACKSPSVEEFKTHLSQTILQNTTQSK
ncbi:MAG: hypothetical protein J6A01_06590 [Proteobacteria bacterium]|nr:hypothetical protein [Pseudomonadota bacterium]